MPCRMLRINLLFGVTRYRLCVILDRDETIEPLQKN
jgi:hypothetical protein